VAAPVGGTGRGRRGTTATVRRTATPVAPRTRTAAASPAWLPWRGWDALGPAARVALAGLLAPAVLAVLLAVIYVLVGTAVWRVLLIGATSVLAFSAVADRDATGWAVWRRSPLLWLFLFTGAAAALTLLLLGAW